VGSFERENSTVEHLWIESGGRRRTWAGRTGAQEPTRRSASKRKPWRAFPRKKVCRKRTSLLLTPKAFLKALVGTLIEHLLERFGPSFLSTLEIKGTIVRVGGFVLTGIFCVPTFLEQWLSQMDKETLRKEFMKRGKETLRKGWRKWNSMGPLGITLL
jgi:hypothetical protein